MDQLKRMSIPVLLLVVIACSWISPFDSIATEKVDAGLKRALISFATARTINAVVSVIQGTDVIIEPSVVGTKAAGIKLAFGEALDPINDLFEKFSNLMLAASVSFGIQHVLISIGGHWLLSAVLTSATFLWGALHFRRAVIPAWVTKLLVITIVLRFAIPAVTVGTDFIFQHFLAKEYSNTQKLLELSTSAVKQIMPPTALPENPSVWEKMKNWVPQDINPAGKIERLLQEAEKWPEHVIRMMVVFLLETLLIPLILLWGLLSFTKSYLGFQVPRLARITHSLAPENQRPVTPSK